MTTILQSDGYERDRSSDGQRQLFDPFGPVNHQVGPDIGITVGHIPHELVTVCGIDLDIDPVSFESRDHTGLSGKLDSVDVRRHFEAKRVLYGLSITSSEGQEVEKNAYLFEWIRGELAILLLEELLT